MYHVHIHIQVFFNHSPKRKTAGFWDPWTCLYTYIVPWADEFSKDALGEMLFKCRLSQKRQIS